MEAMEENWVKLFEKNKFIGAFENHYHLFKRTYPISKNLNFRIFYILIKTFFKKLYIFFNYKFL